MPNHRSWYCRRGGFWEQPRVLEIIGVAIGFGGLTLIVGPAGGGRGAWLALLAAATIAAGALLARRSIYECWGPRSS